MCVKRTTAGISMVVSLIVLAATGQPEPSSPNAKTQLESCQTAVRIILKNYHNTKYAVQRARNSTDASQILPAVNGAQLALDPMEQQPLNMCNEALQKVRGGQQQDTTD